MTSPITDFDGKVAIVTGGASGIGRALATALVARGARVTVADIDGAGAAAVADALGGPPTARAATLDVTDAEAVRLLVESVTADEGRLDLIFNNAGIGAGGPVEHLALEAWDRVIDVDLRSVVHGVVAAYPIMVRQQSGHIVNTASLAGLVPSPVLTPYAAAKAGVVGLSVSLRVEAAAHGVGVSVVCPGPVETPLLDAGAGPSGSAASRGSVGPAAASAPNVRKLLTNALGTPYDPAALADDILAGVLENRALIVAPETARMAWQTFRDTPEEMLAAMAGQAVRSRERRAGDG
jgi:NAD(P)-dependent dehydrogenase (short-subunit alcohol dehydrogenase family)